MMLREIYHILFHFQENHIKGLFNTYTWKLKDWFQDSRCITHLSGLPSKQHEVQLLQKLLHTRINKTKKQKEWKHIILHFWFI